ncbi:tetratricopeptide repeat protein [Streptomyces sp. NPDC005811]|uniref:tetratricopeptide repeat protein n=1 Tax=Streptomyces sp. NPDC005811 TaxID=3154565 RepID=UPI0033DAF624
MPAARTVAVDCHAFGRYPYVGCNNLMRQLLPDICRDSPDLVREFALCVVTLAPDTHTDVLDLCPDLAEALGKPAAIPFMLNRTTWLAHGLASLVLRWRSRLDGAPPLKLEFTNTASADPLQREFLDILSLRADPDLLEVVRDDENDGAEARSERAAADLTPEEHLVRAEELTARKQRSLDLGSVLHHLEHSTASPDVVARAFTAAAEHYLTVGFYEASLHTARTAARYATHGDLATARTLCSTTVYSLMHLGRLDDAEAFCTVRLSTTDDPRMGMICSYALGVIQARLRPPEQRDLAKAAQHMAQAIAFLDSAPQGPGETCNRIFVDKNFRALLAARAGRTDEAIRLEQEGLADLRRLCPERFRAEAPILLQNLSKAHLASKRADLAVASYTEAIALEPFSADLYMERGNAHRARGDHRAALADYRMAIQVGPPTPEMHFNAGLACAAGHDSERALDEYTLALELDPAYARARLNRAALHYRSGRPAEAAQDADAALRTEPDHPDLLCIRGLVNLSSGDLEAALADFSRALVRDPSHPAALKNRSTTLFAMEDVAQALRDADRYLTVRTDAAAFLHRGQLHQSRGSWQQALADYQQAAGYDDADHAELGRRRSACLQGLVDEATHARA